MDDLIVRSSLPKPKDIYSVIAQIGQYKVNAALFALSACHVLERMKDGESYKTEDLALECDLDEKGLLVIFNLLSEAGYLIRSKNGQFRLSEMLRNDHIITIIALESQMFETVFRSSYLRSLLQGEISKEQEFMVNRIERPYMKSFQGLAQIAALRSFRKIRSELVEGIHCDIGRPAGFWGKLVRKIPDQQNIYYSHTITFSSDDCLSGFSALNQGSISSLFLFNSIGWLLKNNPQELGLLLDRLDDRSVLIIVDVLTKRGVKSPFQKQLDFEWWTMGQCTFEDKKEQLRNLQTLGFDLKFYEQIDELFDLNVFKKNINDE